MVDIATRVHNRKWKIDPIIRSLSIDFSKATASAILNNSSLSALLFNIIFLAKKKWA